MSLRSALARPIPAAAATTVVLLPVLVAMAMIWTRTSSPQPIDYALFGPGGAALLTGRWSAIFSQPLIQAGPFELAPFGVVQLLGVSTPLGWTLALTVLGALTAFVSAIVLRPTLAPDLRSSVLAAAGALVLALAGPTQAIWSLGHPAEVLIPLLWVVAGRMALRDRPVVAALLVAASSGFEVWGLLGAPVILLATRPRLVRSALAGVAVLAVLWVPFVVAGPFAMFSFAWGVAPTSLFHLLQPHATSYPWTFRLLQALLAVAAGSAAALLLRGRAGTWGPWVVPMTVVSARLVLDPVLAGYYWDPILVCAVGALVLAARHRDLPAAAVAALLLVLATDVAAPVPRAVAIVALTLLAATAAGWRAGRRPARSDRDQGRSGDARATRTAMRRT